MPHFLSIQLFTGVIAGLFVVGLPVWLLGLPGVDGHYARGWKLGLNTLFFYPILWLLNRTVYWRAINRSSESELAQWQTLSGLIYIVLFVVAALTLILSFKSMRKAD
ncbi:MAG: hypothetical protein EOP09_19895 [Proteobacteria bacterium]|nr:MAG: hypothetical protein EOP09_19895 [Pseudomonadota bacterium]